MDNTSTDIDKARKEAVGYVCRDRHSHSKDRCKSKKDKETRSESRKSKGSASPEKRHHKASVGSSGRHHKSSTRQEEEDHNAKRRSRRSRTPTVVPGAVSSTGEHRSRSKSSHRTSNKDQSSKSHEKVRYPSSSRSPRPGAVLERGYQADARRGRTSSKTSKEDHARKSNRDRDSKSSKRHPSKAATTPGVEQVGRPSSSKSPHNHSTSLPSSLPIIGAGGDGEELTTTTTTIAAMIVDEDDEEERFQKRMRKREAELRLQMAMQQHNTVNSATVANTVSSAAEEDEKTQAPTDGRGVKICRAVICLVVIVAAIVGALFGTGVMRRSSSQPTTSVSSDENKDIQDTQVTMDTVNPTQAPFVGTTFPTNAPTFLAYDPPDPDQCELIRQGLQVEGQEEMIENNFALVLNGTMSEDTDIEDLKVALTKSIQNVVMPKLTGCEESNQRRGLRSGLIGMQRRRLQDPYAYIVGNVIVVDITSLGECADNQTCESFQVDIILYTQGDEVSTIALVGRIADAFNNGGSLVVQLEIDEFFDEVELVAVRTLDPTPAPIDVPSLEPSSVPSGAPTATASLLPTFAPVSFPTTDAPTKKPSPAPTTRAPSKAPSYAPTNVPSTAPSARPSIQPAPGVTPVPTSEPSKSPSNVPTPVPTAGPTSSPTSRPTSAPTKAPSSEPSTNPTNVPTSEPTHSPTPSPTSSPTDAPSTSPTIKTRLQIITYALVSAGVDENDLHADIIYWMDTVDDWEPPSDQSFHWVDRYAMAVYFKETQGSNWILMDTGVSDRSGVSVCDWDGVSCDTTKAVSSFVTNDAWAYSAAATIPTEMGLLSNLLYFRSQSGDVAESGTIPAGILSMTALTQLRLDDSLFTTIADVSVLSNLKYLDMRSNTILGSAIPDTLCELTQLTKLILYENDHSSPLNNILPNTIPTCVGQLSDKMKHFTLGYVNLEGTIPTEVSELTKLTLLNLRQNDFDAGPYPDFVNELTTLKSLLLDNNQLQGTLPASISSLTALTLLDLQRNSLTGSIPVLPNFGIIRDCRLKNNKFSNTRNAGICTV